MFESILIILLGFVLLAALYFKTKSRIYKDILEMVEEDNDFYLTAPHVVNNPGTYTFVLNDKNATNTPNL